MKKILFASTALVATAGVAAAEITMSGYGRVGLLYNEGNANETEIEQRMRLNITGIAETDAGVKLEARFRLQSDSNSNNNIEGVGPGAAGFAVSYGGLRVDVGNVSNVFDSGDQVDLYGYGVGFTAFLEQNAAFDAPANHAFDEKADDTTTIKVRYTVGDFSASLSYSDTRPSIAVAATPGSAGKAAVVDAEQLQLGVGYTLANGMTIGAAYSDTETAGASVEDWIIGLNGTAGAFGYSVIVGDSDRANYDVAFGASVNYEVSSATSIRAMVSTGGDDANDTAYGLGFRHGLGGGVTLAGGVGSDTASNTRADLGVVFNF